MIAVIDFADELAAYIVAEGVAVKGVDLFLDRLPEQPDQCMALVLYSAGMPQFVHDIEGVAIEAPNLQVLSRAATSLAAYSNSYRAYRALAAVVNDGPYLRVVPMSAPFLLNRDANERTIYAFNVEAIRST